MVWFLSPEKFLDECHDYAWLPSLFSNEEIEKVIKIGDKRGVKKATTRGNLSSKARKNKVAWIKPDDESEWLFRKLTDVVIEANKLYFGFTLAGFFEPIQFTIYENKGDHYGTHCDRALGTNCRKLSLVVNLSDPSDYEGGELLLQPGGGEPTVMHKEKGAICFFPSWITHQVTPITKGTRYTLVAWVHGPSFK